MRNARMRTRSLRAALFVDFDNIYSGLLGIDKTAANIFATSPSRWMRWLSSGMPGLEDVGQERMILQRFCYMNPDLFRRFRECFVNAAFTVVDCPRLTHQGKNSSDIHMAIDILDALTHPTYFDEFILFSGDSDFLPIIRRLRSHARATTVLAADNTARAYAAACDCLIPKNAFLCNALGWQLNGRRSDHKDNGQNTKRRAAA